MQATLFDLPARPTRKTRPAPAAGPVNGAPLLLVAPAQVVSLYAAQRAVMELYPLHARARTAARAAALLELPASHPAVSMALDCAADAARVFAVRGSVHYSEVQRLARLVVSAGGGR